jgi:hypothetical protein
MFVKFESISSIKTPIFRANFHPQLYPVHGTTEIVHILFITEIPKKSQCGIYDLWLTTVAFANFNRSIQQLQGLRRR